jgi:hypothetical protein
LTPQVTRLRCFRPKRRHWGKRVGSNYRHYEDAIAGLALMALAAFVLWYGRNYPVGSLKNMGPGWFPRTMCFIVLGLGLVLVASNLRKRLDIPDEPDELRLRPITFVAGSGIVFGLTLESVGLLPAVLIMIVISGLAVSGRSAREWILTIIGLEAMTLAMFWLVSIPIPLFGPR